MLALYRVILFIVLHKSLRETVEFDHPNESCRPALSCSAVSIFATCNLGFFSERIHYTRKRGCSQSGYYSQNAVKSNYCVRLFFLRNNIYFLKPTLKKIRLDSVDLTSPQRRKFYWQAKGWPPLNSLILCQCIMILRLNLNFLKHSWRTNLTEIGYVIIVCIFWILSCLIL